MTIKRTPQIIRNFQNAAAIIVMLALGGFVLFTGALALSVALLIRP